MCSFCDAGYKLRNGKCFPIERKCKHDEKLFNSTCVKRKCYNNLTVNRCDDIFTCLQPTNLDRKDDYYRRSQFKKDCKFVCTNIIQSYQFLVEIQGSQHCHTGRGSSYNRDRRTKQGRMFYIDFEGKKYCRSNNDNRNCQKRDPRYWKDADLPNSTPLLRQRRRKNKGRRSSRNKFRFDLN